MTFEDLIIDAKHLAKRVDIHFIDLASSLRQLHELFTQTPDVKQPVTFDECLEKIGVSKRRAFYLIDVDRTFSTLKIAPSRLTHIGWTKLSLMTRIVNSKNVEKLLTHAETKTVDEFRAYISGVEPPTHTLVFKLTKDQYGVIAGALLVNGAYLTSGAGLANKEISLMKLCRTLRKAWDAGIL